MSGRGNVLDFASFRRKKATAENSVNEREPLYVTYMNNLQSSPHLTDDEAVDFGTRIDRIKNSIEKLHRLIKEMNE